MTPPINGTEITNRKVAENLVSQLTPNEAKHLFGALELLSLPKLEEEHLHIDSSGWKETTTKCGFKILVDPKGEVIELVEINARWGNKKTFREYMGTQFFTKEAAIRRAQKMGKKLPTREIWKEFLNKKYQGNYQAFLEGENIKFCGYGYPLDSKEEFANIGPSINERVAYRASDGYGSILLYKISSNIGEQQNGKQYDFEYPHTKQLLPVRYINKEG